MSSDQISPASQIQIDWTWLREQLRQTSWSDEAQKAGDWAIDIIAASLGPRWPPAWKEPTSAPPELMSCWWSLAGLVGSIRMALALSRLTDCEGLASLVKQMKRGMDTGRLASPRLQLSQAALAHTAGYQPRLEPLLPGAETKADLEIRGDGIALGIEAFALLRDTRTMQASAWLDEVREELRHLGEQFSLDIHGAVDEPPRGEETTEWLTDLGRYMELSAQGLTLPPFQSGGVTVMVAPSEGRGSATHFRMPMVSFGERLGARLSRKASQAKRSNASWLLIDSLDHLWHMTAWSRQSLDTKAQQLAALLKAELDDADHILGVTITDGAALMRGNSQEQTVVGSDYLAMARRSDAWHTRESVIVALRPGAEEGVNLWRSILDAESDWLRTELHRNGVMAPPELAQK